MSVKRLRRRTPLRFKQIRSISDEVEGRLGVSLNLANSFLEEAHFEGIDLILVDRVPKLMCLTNDSTKIWFPTLRGLLDWEVKCHWAEVDHGAIPFLMNGADCMAAGIQESDSRIGVGAPIWIRDEVHGRPLAIGWSLMDGDVMRQSSKGKAVLTVHWVGDELWSLDSQ